MSELFVGTPVPGCPPGHGTVLRPTTVDVIPRPHRGRGNLLLSSEVLYHPIHIEHFGYSMLIGAILKHSAVPEIAPQAFPSVTTSAFGLLAMTGVVDGHQHLTNRVLN